MNLTVKRVAKLLRNGQPGRHRDGEVRGLYLCVGGKKNANWQLRYELHHRAHWMGLGSAFDFGLKDARERAKKYRQQLADGNDPLQLKRAERAAKAATAATVKLFKQCAEGYLEDNRAKWKSAKHGAQWVSSLEDFVFPKIGALDVATIEMPHVLSVLEQRVEAQLGRPAGQLWKVRTVSADRIRNRIEVVLNYASARGYRDGAKPNPARWEALKHIFPQPTELNGVKHHAAVDYDKVPSVFAELNRREGIGARALEFLILTAARTGEVLGATWDEINLADKVWIIPAARMKGGAEHKVPLSGRALEILHDLPREANNSFIFIGTRQPHLSNTALSEVLKRLGRVETVHGFRSSFSDWAHEATAHSDHTIEISLAHKVGNKVEQAYRRGPMFNKRRRLMDDWARFCTTPTTRTATVTPIRQRADVS
jgi:integrase